MSHISLPIKEEEKLIKEISRGGHRRETALDRIYRHYLPHLIRFYRSRITNEQDAEDLTAAVFGKILGGINDYQWQGISISAWIYTIARRTLIDYYRKQGRKKEISLSEGRTVVSKDKNPEEQAQVSYQKEALWTNLERLPEREYKIIYMKFFEGYTNRTISRITGLSETNVGTIIHRTVQKLRRMV